MSRGNKVRAHFTNNTLSNLEKNTATRHVFHRLPHKANARITKYLSKINENLKNSFTFRAHFMKNERNQNRNESRFQRESRLLPQKLGYF